MKKTTAITGLFRDIGGVLLTNGWDHHARRRAAAYFKLPWAEFMQVAECLGSKSILHTDYHSTRTKLAALGLDCAQSGKVLW